MKWIQMICKKFILTSFVYLEDMFKNSFPSRKQNLYFLLTNFIKIPIVDI